MIVWGITLVIGAQRIQRGSRTDACILFALFLIGDVARWLTYGNISLFSVGVSVAMLLAIGNAVWGTFELARIRQEEATIPPPAVPISVTMTGPR